MKESWIRVTSALKPEDFAHDLFKCGRTPVIYINIWITAFCQLEACIGGNVICRYTLGNGISSVIMFWLPGMHHPFITVTNAISDPSVHLF